MSDGRVIIEIAADTSAYEKAVASLNESTTKRVNIISQGMQAAGKGLTLGLTAPILAFAALSTKAAMDFESSFAGVRKTVDATEEEYAKLAQAARDMSEQKVVGADQVNDIMALAGQLGIAKENLVDYAGVIADLDVSTNLGAEQAASQIAKYSNITKMAQEDTSRLGSTIVDLGNNYATTEADIMDMSMRVAASGKQIGLTDAQIMALSTSLSSVGINAEAGGTAISTVMSQIDKDVALGTDTLEVWADVAGMTVEQFTDAWENRPVEALQAVFTGMSKVTDEGGNLNLVLDELGVTSLRQTDVMKRLGNASELFGGAVDTATNAWNANSALAEEAGKRYETTESSMAMLKNTLTNTAAEMGGPLLGAVNDIIGGAKPLLEVVRNIAEGFSEASPGTQKLIIGLVATLAAIGPVTTAFGKFMETGNRFQEGLRGISAAMKAEEAAMKAMAASSAQAVAAEELKTAKTQASVTAQQLLAAKKAQMAIQEDIATKKRLGTLTQEELKQLRADAAKQKAIATSARYSLAKEKEAISEAKGSVAKTLDTAQTNANTAAKTGNAAASSADAVATAASNTAKAAGIPITMGLTVATRALGAAIMANPLMIAVTAAMLLVPLIASLAEAYKKATDCTDGLTAASKKQKAVVDGAQKTYDDAVASQGELSDSAQAAKGALDAEKEAFEANRQTLGDVIKECDRVIEAHRSMNEQFSESIAAADGEAGSILHLLDEMDRLTATGNETADSQARMQSVMGSLGGSVESLNAAYNTQTGELLLTTEQVRALATAEADRIRSSVRTDALTAAYGEQYTVAAQLAVAQEELAAAQAEYNEEISHFFNWASTDKVTKLQTEVDELTEAQKSNAETINELTAENQRWFDRQTALKKAVRDGGSAVLDSDQKLQAYGITLQDVIDYEDEQAAIQEGELLDAQIQYTAAVEEGITAINEFSASHGWFKDALESTGITSAELATRLADAGYSIDDLTGRFSSASDIIKSSFEALELDTSHSVESIQANLSDANAKYAGFADDLEFLMANAGTDAEKALVAGLADMGAEEGAAIAAGLAEQVRSGSTEAFAGIAEEMGNKWAEEARIAAVQMGTTMGAAVTEATIPAKIAAGEGGKETGAEFVGQAAQAIGDSPELTEAAGELGTGMTDALSESIVAGTPDVQAAIDTLFETVSAADYDLDLSGIGERAASSLAGGIAGGKGAARSATKVLTEVVMLTFKAMQLKPIGAQAALQFSAGVNSGTGTARSAGASLGTAALGGARAASGGGYSIGYGMAAGIASGIGGGRSLVANAMAAIVASGIVAGRRAAAINSPSRKTRELIGQGLGEGVEYGVIDLVPRVDKAMEGMVDGAIESGQKGMHALVETLDLSKYDFDGFRVDTSALERRGTAVARSESSTVINNYTVDGINVNGNSRAENAIDVLVGLRRKGKM